MMHDGPLVSVVTPTLNRGRYLEATLRSVQQQTYPRVQHLVIDGGSEDDSIDILRRYEGSYDLTWISEPDRGMYHAINKGLSRAHGDILAYLNSDDFYLPWTVESIVRYFAQSRTAGFVFGDALNIDEQGLHRMIFQPPFDWGYVKRTGFLVQPTVFWSREVYTQQGGFDESIRYVADCEYWMRAGAQWPFARLDEVLAVETDHGETQRALHAVKIRAEVAALRETYGAHGVGSRMLRFRDRARAAIWRRVLLIRFLKAAYGKGRRGGPDAPWASFLKAARPQIQWKPLALSVIPTFGARFYGRAIVWPGIPAPVESNRR